MPQDPTKGPDTEVESPVDRFEHEIEELEQPIGHGARMWLVGVAVMAAIVGAFMLGSFLQSKKPDASMQVIMVIETIEPKSGLLADKPTRFQWDSIARTTMYLLTIREYQGTTDIIVKQTPTSTVELSEAEISRLARGGRYQWKVLAMGAEGTIGEGNGSFSL
jgi:hypothetical protein